jgi:hypothetical protein
MPIAVNPQSGEVVYLDDAGAWQKAQTAVNPQTKEMLAFDGKGWNPVPRQSKGVMGHIDDVVRKLASGVTFGWADEIAAKADEITGRGGSYEENLQRERARDAQISPWVGVPAEIAGGVGAAVAAAPVTGAAAAISGASRLPQFARMAGIGGAAGAAYGAGSAEGDRVSGAAQGAAIGAPLGVAAPHIMQGAIRAGQAVRGAISPQSQVAADLGRAISRDAMTPDQLATRAATLAQERPGVATLADAGGENVRGLVERVAQTPGAGRTVIVPTLTQRQQGQANRIAADLRGLTGTHRTAVQAIDQTMEARRQASRPLYDEAMQFDVTSSPQLSDTFLEAIQTGWGRAIVNSPELRRNLQTEYGIQGNPGPDVMMAVIDAWKRQADDLVTAAQRSGNNNRARIISQMRDRVVRAADEANPAYAEARNAWAGPSRYMDAVNAGRDILNRNVSAEELATRIAAMPEVEREAFRIGAVSSIVGRMGSDPARMGDMTKYLRSPEVRAKVAAVMPTPEAAQAWHRRLEFEVQSSELTGRALGNSATARRLMERRDADGIAGDLVLDALSGSPAMSLWRRVIQGTTGRVRDTLRSRSDARLADTLMNPQSPQQLQAVLRRAQATAAPLSDMTQGASAVGANAAWPYGP